MSKSRKHTARNILVVSLLIVAQAEGQQSSLLDPSLEDALRHLQANRDSYIKTVPDFFCDEHVVSESKESKLIRSTTDSIFRLQRTSSDRIHWFLMESREIKSVNGIPTKRQNFFGPTVFSGAFSSAAFVVSLDFARCYTYRLSPNQTLYNQPATVIEYSSKPPDSDNTSCLEHERHNGYVWFAPQTFQLLRVEMEVPDHKLYPGYNTTSEWKWSIDYAPVSFDERTFWLPKRITSRAISESEDGKGEWSFTADYSNYHKLTVSSHIVPTQ